MAAVTGVHCHPAADEFQDVLLTSSVDWSIKLRLRSEPQVLSATGAARPPIARTRVDVGLPPRRPQRPIVSFDAASDSVYDARWSPVHPALFASVDGTGRVDLWNVDDDITAPIAGLVVDRWARVPRARERARVRERRLR